MNNKEKYDAVIADGSLKIGYTRVKVNPWNFSANSNQCFKCLEFGHSHTTCSKEQKCLRCSKNHHYKNCDQKDKLLCANCGENHAACSKTCKSMIKANESKKNPQPITHKNHPTQNNSNNSNIETISYIKKHIDSQISNFLHFMIDFVSNTNEFCSSIEKTNLESSPENHVLLNAVKNRFGTKFVQPIKIRLTTERLLEERLSNQSLYQTVQHTDHANNFENNISISSNNE